MTFNVKSKGRGYVRDSLNPVHTGFTVTGRSLEIEKQNKNPFSRMMCSISVVAEESIVNDGSMVWGPGQLHFWSGGAVQTPRHGKCEKGNNPACDPGPHRLFTRSPHSTASTSMKSV